MALRLVKTEDAVGMILCHDMTQIIPGVYKGAKFRKGHIVEEADIPVLKSMGKNELYVYEPGPGLVHENDAAQRLYRICTGESPYEGDHTSGIRPSREIKEGKIEAFADRDGLFTVEGERLNAINSLGEVMIASRHGNVPVKSGDDLAGMRAIPLLIAEEKLQEAERIGAGSPLFSILPYVLKKAWIVTTGNEVYSGLIKDGFGPVVKEKLQEYGARVLGQTILDDNREKITKEILSAIEKGADLVLCTGGMSVDPDDVTPSAIRATGARMVTYGAPVLPGAMFALAYYNDGGRIVPIAGLPGCVMYNKRTIFDLMLPRILAGQLLETEDITHLGEGGLCLNCKVCIFPNCGFGK